MSKNAKSKDFGWFWWVPVNNYKPMIKLLQNQWQSEVQPQMFKTTEKKENEVRENTTFIKYNH